MSTKEAAFVAAPNLPFRTRTRYNAAVPQCAVGKRALGVDYGLARVGLAVSVGVAPRLLSALHVRNPRAAASAVADAARANLAEEIVLGLPLNLEGEYGEQANRTLLFAKHLVRSAPWVPLLLLDERFTTTEADALLSELGMGRDERIALRDSAAAAQILTRYFAGPGEVTPQRFYTPPPHYQQLGATESTSSNHQHTTLSYREWRAQRIKAAQEHARILANKKRRKA